MREAIGIGIIFIVLFLGILVMKQSGIIVGHRGLSNQHDQMMKELKEAHNDVKENGRKLDILLNIATNNVSKDIVK